MKINVSIKYEAESESERGETAADEEAALNKLAGLVEQFGQGLINAAMAEGMSVEINRSYSP